MNQANWSSATTTAAIANEPANVAAHARKIRQRLPLVKSQLRLIALIPEYPSRAAAGIANEVTAAAQRLRKIKPANGIRMTARIGINSPESIIPSLYKTNALPIATPAAKASGNRN